MISRAATGWVAVRGGDHPDEAVRFPVRQSRQRNVNALRKGPTP